MPAATQSQAASSSAPGSSLASSPLSSSSSAGTQAALVNVPLSHRKCALCGTYPDSGLKKATEENAGLWSAFCGLRLQQGHRLCASHLSSDDPPVPTQNLPAVSARNSGQPAITDLFICERHLVEAVRQLHAALQSSRQVIIFPRDDTFDCELWTGLSSDNLKFLHEQCHVRFDDLVAALTYLRTGYSQQHLAAVLHVSSQQILSKMISAGREALMKDIVPKFTSWRYAYELSLREWWRILNQCV